MTQEELGAMYKMLALDLLAEHLDILQGCDMIAWVVPPGSNHKLVVLKGKVAGDLQMCPSGLPQ